MLGSSPEKGEAATKETDTLLSRCPGDVKVIFGRVNAVYKAEDTTRAAGAGMKAHTWVERTVIDFERGTNRSYGLKRTLAPSPREPHQVSTVVFRGLDEERGVRGDSHNSDSRDKLKNTATHGMRTYRT